MPAGACENFANDLRLGGGFRGVHQFPPPLSTGQSRIGRNMAKQLAIGEVPNLKSGGRHELVVSRAGFRPTYACSGQWQI